MTTLEEILFGSLILAFGITLYMVGKADIFNEIPRMLNDWATKNTLVRCKECKYCENNNCTYPQNYVVEKVPEIGEHYRIAVHQKVAENHFCGFGERKEL